METCLPTGDTLALSNGGGEDHISTLDDALLSNIISRLPLKDVVRTAVLSPRWHHVWASTPLILNDSDLLGDLQNDDDMKWHNIIGDTNDEGTKWHNIIDAVSGALYAHPGPFHLIYLSHVCNYAASQGGGALLCSWLRVLADKGVQNLRLINESLVGYADLPVDILHINSVVTLYLKLWTFPKTNNLSRNRAVFPHLYHLWLCETYIRTIDLDRLLQYSVELRKLTLVYNNAPAIILIRSLSLQCLIFWMATAHEIDARIAPDLKRIILWGDIFSDHPNNDFHITLHIGSARAIKVLGYLNPAIHTLKIFETNILVGTLPSQRTIIPSVEILAVKVRLGVPTEAKMLLSFLRCFPNVETLHVLNGGMDEPIDKINFNFWKEAVPIICVRSRMTKLVFKNCRGGRGEFEFLRFIWERAKVLEKMELVLADEIDLDSVHELLAKLKSLVCVKRALEDRSSNILVRSRCSSWSVLMASDLSIYDPFDY